MQIIRVISGSPAAEAGIHDGDRIVAVDGKLVSAISSDVAANLLQGEEGSSVNLAVAGGDNPERQITVRRRRVEVPSVDLVAMLDRPRGIGYFRITSFQKTTVRELDAALWKLHRDGMQRLIIDVRGNPGGLLPAAVEVSDRFLERGVIVSTRGRSTPGRRHLCRPGSEKMEHAFGGDCRSGQRQRGGDFFGGNPRFAAAARSSACGATAKARCKAFFRWTGSTRASV